MLVNRTAACGRDAREQEGPTTKTERTNGGPGTVVAMGCVGWTSDAACTHVTALSPYNHYIVTYTPHSKFQVTLFIYLLSKLIFFNLKKIKFTENKLKYMTSNQFRQLFYEIFVGPVFI